MICPKCGNTLTCFGFLSPHGRIECQLCWKAESIKQFGEPRQETKEENNKENSNEFSEAERRR